MTPQQKIGATTRTGAAVSDPLAWLVPDPLISNQFSPQPIYLCKGPSHPHSFQHYLGHTEKSRKGAVRLAPSSEMMFFLSLSSNPSMPPSFPGNCPRNLLSASDSPAALPQGSPERSLLTISVPLSQRLPQHPESCHLPMNSIQSGQEMR